MKFTMRVQLVAFFLVARTMCAQSDAMESIKNTLATKYPVTTTTADRKDLVTTGAVLVLKKSNLLSGDATGMIPLSNNYKGGKITQGLIGQIVNGGDGTRTFVAGEKLWVTGIDVKPKGIVFTLVSDPYGDVRYRALLTFPFARGTTPSAADALATVGEVFDLEESGNAAAETNSTGGAQPNPGELPPVEAPAPASSPQGITNWDSAHGRLTSEDLQRINQPSVRFDMNFLRLNPTALDQKPVMQYFIALNNCNDRNIEHAIYNELDYPALVAFYRSKSSQILNSLPRTVTDVALYRFIGGQQSGAWKLWTQSLTLGEYNLQRKAFPLKYPGKSSVEIADSLSTNGARPDFARTCPAAVKPAAAANAFLPAEYDISIKPAVYRELPMDEDAARKYIDSSSGQRNVFLAVDVTILDSPPVIATLSNTGNKATFRAQTARISVIDGKTLKALGALYDDHTLPAEVQVVQQQPSAAPAKPANQWAFGDHMYEIRQAVYISLAADACGWPMTADQTADLSKFLARVMNGNFNEREQYNLVYTRVKNAISAKGRSNFCADPMERRDFDKAASTVAPLGPIAAPALK
jgi:hypothetical protein